MEYLNHIFQNFNEYLIVLLLIVLFFKESLMGFINSKLGKSDAPAWGERATKELSRLTQYANHDTTDRLNTLIEMEKLEHASAQEMRDTMKDIGRTLEEIKTYGIVCRK